MKRGAKGKFDYWLTEDGLILLKGWARDGLTDEQIAHNMKITKSTLYDWKNKFADISTALKETKEIVDQQVVNALYQKAMAGDTTAMIFWLKNRRTREWRDRFQQDIYTPEPIKVDFDYSKYTKDELKALKELLKKQEGKDDTNV
jgi:hypothetical protein